MKRLIIVVFAIFVVALGVIFYTGIPFTGTEAATVTNLGDSYEIRVEKEKRIILHPDQGFFPIQHREVTFLTWGLGATETIDGQEFRKFSIGKDAFALLDNCLYSDGEILFSVATRKLIIKGNLSPNPSYSYYPNHSGTYLNANFVSPTIVDLQATSTLKELDGALVRVKGKNTTDGFVTEHGVSYEYVACHPMDNQPSQILARVILTTTGRLYLRGIRKEGVPQEKCCFFGNK